MTKTLFTALMTALLLTTYAGTVVAGAWTVVTLDQLPANVQAGEPVRVSFQVQQHGIHPLVLKPGEITVTAQLNDGSQHIEVTAQASGAPGHYTAEIVFPAGGVWTWSVHPSWFPPAVMPDLLVAPATPQAAILKGAAPANWDWWQQALVQVLGSLRRPEKSAALPSAGNPGQDQVAYGKALFVAKGCTTCHLHGQIATRFSVQVGPELTDYPVVPEYVKLWLHDPKAIKPATMMPNLQLSDQEIDALVAFLSTAQEE